MEMFNSANSSMPFLFAFRIYLRNPVQIRVPVTNIDKIRNSGRYLYFGMLVQYGGPVAQKFEYTYYLQGYIDSSGPM